MKCVRVLSGVALVSFLGVQPSVATSKVIEQAPNSTPSAQTQPMIIANPLGIIRDVIQTGEQMNQTRLREQRRQEAERRRLEAIEQRRLKAEQRRLEAEQRRRYFESLSPEEKKSYFDQKLARGSNESYENWYGRIDPIIQRMRGEDYRAWKATLSSKDREAYDAITKRRNYEAREQFNQMVPRIFEGVLREEEESRQRQRENDCKQYGYSC